MPLTKLACTNRYVNEVATAMYKTSNTSSRYYQSTAQIPQCERTTHTEL